MPDGIKTRWLDGWGEVEWARLQEAADGMTCAWADYDGFHIGPCPTQAPPYSHIWGWSDDGGTLLRGRIDAGRVTVGWLRTSGAQGEPVDCVVRDLLTWRQEHERLHITMDRPYPERMRTVEILGPGPVSFITA